MAPDWLALYIEEDVGSGDITGNSVFPGTAQGSARIVAREPAIVAGAEHAAEIFRRLGAKPTVTVADGKQIAAGATVLTVKGPTRGILAGERLALNLLARMSGIATQTHDLAARLSEARSRARVAGTRKTTPGFRFFEKEAIRMGGGDPHRMGLFDAAMVKDNHIAASGGDVASVVQKVKAAQPGKLLTCEVESLDHALAAAKAGADWLLIDNQEPAVGRAWAKDVVAAFPGVKIEASGGITPANIGAYGWADRVSLGWLTQKSVAKDFSLEWGATGGKSKT